MYKPLAFAGLVTAGAVAAVLYLVAGNEAPPGAEGGSRPAIGTPAPAVATVTATGAAATGSAATPAAVPAAPPAPAAAGAAAPAIPLIPAIASATERQATQELRREALPHFLQAADATLARVRGELAQLQAQGAPAAEIAAKEELLRRLVEVRAQVLARNADITPAR